MEQFVTNSEQETQQLAFAMGKKLVPGDVIAYSGGMGVGKTAFTRGLARGLGITQPVTSPTFALVNVYAGSPSLYHFDMYRVTTYDDLYSTGFFDYLEEEAVLAVEWSENIADFLPLHVIRVGIATDRDQLSRRLITIEGWDRF